MSYLSNKFEISKLTHYKGMKATKKCKNWVVWGVRSHPRSSTK